MNLWDFFFHPVLRAPLWGTLWMCIASSLMGVVILLKKRSLLSETLSHATYPGIVAAVSLFALLWPQQEGWVFFPILLGAFATSLLALYAMEGLERRFSVKPDAALCFVLASFFGGGVLAASSMQFSLPTWHQAVQMLLFGQAATMTDLHIALYAALTCLVVSFLYASFRPLQALLFDRNFALSLGLRVPLFEKAIFWLLLLSLIIGMRSVGVVLMSGMAIAPAVAARQCTDRLQKVFLLAALFGALSGLLGNVLSVKLSEFFSGGEERISLPTGPMIVLIGASFAFAALLFAPKRGLLFRLGRMGKFRLRCLGENLLKGIWKGGPLSRAELQQSHQIPSWSLSYVLLRLRGQGWIEKKEKKFSLTKEGLQKAQALVRLHRLWELYLAQELGWEAARVHADAEKMEHILTEEMEEKLTRLLAHPTHDPHSQPIPERPS